MEKEKWQKDEITKIVETILTTDAQHRQVWKKLQRGIPPVENQNHMHRLKNI